MLYLALGIVIGYFIGVAHATSAAKKAQAGADAAKKTSDAGAATK